MGSRFFYAGEGGSGGVPWSSLGLGWIFPEPRMGGGGVTAVREAGLDTGPEHPKKTPRSRAWSKRTTEP